MASSEIKSSNLHAISQSVIHWDHVVPFVRWIHLRRPCWCHRRGSNGSISVRSKLAKIGDCKMARRSSALHPRTFQRHKNVLCSTTHYGGLPIDDNNE